MEYFIREAGEITGVTSKLKPDQRTAAHILEYVFHSIVNWKKINQEPPGAFDL